MYISSHTDAMGDTSRATRQVVYVNKLDIPRLSSKELPMRDVFSKWYDPTPRHCSGSDQTDTVYQCKHRDA